MCNIRKKIPVFLLSGILLLMLFLLVIPVKSASAHQPILEKNLTPEKSDPGKVPILQIKDPTLASQAVYGRLSNPSEVDIYSFTPQKNEEIPVKLLVPLRVSNINFKPVMAILGENIKKKVDLVLPITLPGMNQGILLPPEAHPDTFLNHSALKV